MANRISGYNVTEPLAPIKGSNGGGQVADKTQGGSAPSAATPASSADTVSITGPALTLQKLGEAVAASPVVNTQKVSTVKQSVQNGSYKVDSGRVADKILQYERGLS